MKPHFFLSILFATLLASIPKAEACWLQTGGWTESCESIGGIPEVRMSTETWPGRWEFLCHHDAWQPEGYYSWGPFDPYCPLPDTPPRTDKPIDAKQCQSGSIIDVGRRSVSELIPVVGAPFYLRYDSGKVNGFRAPYHITKQVTDGTIPSSLSSATFEVEVAGRTLSDTVSSFTTNMTHTTEWDGLDNTSNPVYGSVEVTTSQSTTGTPIHPRDEPVPRKSSDFGGLPVFLGQEVAERILMGGWHVSIAHRYDKVRKRVELGTGEVSSLKAEYLSGNNTYRAVSPDGSEVYIFNSDGFHIQTLNPLTGSTKYTITYGGAGQLQSITDAYSKTTTFTHNSSLRPTKITAPYGQETLLETNGNGYLTKVTAPDSTFYEMTYTGTKGLLATFERPSGKTSTFTYDIAGRLLTDSGSDGYTVTLTHSFIDSTTDQVQVDTSEGEQAWFRNYLQFGSSDGQIRRYHTPYNVELLTTSATYGTFSYDKQNGHSTITTWDNDPRFANGIARYPYSFNYTVASGPSVTTTTAKAVTYLSGTGPFNIDTLTTTSTTNSKSFVETYDGTLNKLTYTSPLSRTQTVQLNSQERPTLIQHADLTATSLTYNGNGQLTEITQGGRTTEFTYNGDGWVSSVENALGQTTSYTYDDNGRVLTTTLPDTRVLSYTWNANGDLLSVTPPSRPSHSFTFGSNDLPSVYTPPSIGGTVTTSYTYDLDRRLKKITRPSGAEIDLTYSLKKISTIETSLGDYTFNYLTTNDELYEGISPSGVSTSILHLYMTDLVTGYQVSGNGYGRIGFAYDSFARISDINVLDSGGTPLHSASFTFDDDGLLTGAGDLTLTRHASRGYITDIDLGTVEESLTYNTFGELTGKTVVEGANTLYSFSLTRDLLGRVSQKVETIGGVTTTYDYTYDTAGRLVDVDKNSLAYSEYVYNSNSNRTSRTISGIPVSSTTDNQDRMLTHGTLTFSHNQNGERTQKSDSSSSPAAITDYTYDVVGSLIRVDLPSTDYIEYLYDAFDRRSVRKVNGTVDRYYVYQSDLQIAAEYDSGYALVARYVYASQSHVPDYVVKSGINYRIVTDHLGSVRLVVRADTGAVVQAIAYDEFGRVLSDSNPGFQAFGFAGGLYDHQTSLVRFGARDYDPETGRWLSKDPILFDGGDTNLYGYVLNNPVNLVDPSGLKVFYISIGGIGAIANSPGSGSGVARSSSFGIGFDTSSSSFFTFASTGSGTKASGAFAGIGFSFGYFSGNQSQFMGRGRDFGFSLGYGSFGGGVHFSQSSGHNGFSLDFYGPGAGSSHYDLNTNTCPP